MLHLIILEGNIVSGMTFQILLTPIVIRSDRIRIQHMRRNRIRIHHLLDSGSKKKNMYLNNRTHIPSFNKKVLPFLDAYSDFLFFYFRSVLKLYPDGANFENWTRIWIQSSSDCPLPQPLYLKQPWSHCESIPDKKVANIFQ